MGAGGITPPVIFDDGDAGTWLEAMFFSPCLNISDYGGDRLANRDGLALIPSLHERKVAQR